MWTLAFAGLPTFTWDIAPILFEYPDWLPLPGNGLRYYSLLYVGVFLGGYRLVDWQLRRGGGDEEDAADFVLYAVIAILGGARVGHVLFYDFEKFLEDPLWLFMIWKGGLASHGATAGLFLAVYLYTKSRGQSFIEMCDRFTYGVALSTILIRIGNWFNSEIVGRVTDGTWGVLFTRHDGLNGPLRHPSQLYEAAFGMLVLATLFVADKALGKEKRPRGAMLGLFLALYFSGRFFLEYYKEYQTDAGQVNHAVDFSSALPMGQMLSMPLALAGFIGFFVALKKQVPAKWYGLDDEDDEVDEDDSKEPEVLGGDPDVNEVLASPGAADDDD